MATTRLRNGKQLGLSSSGGSIMISDGSNEAAWLAPPVGDKILAFDDTTNNAPRYLNIGTNLSIDTGTWTLNASAGAGGYATIQEEGSGLTARTTLNFVGGGFTAADDAGNSRTNVTLDATLNALAAHNTNGILTQTAADTFTGRTITGTASRISVTNGDGVSGNPTINIDTGYVGQSTITTLGTIGTGVWQGTAVGATFGGTGQTTYAVGDLLSANTTSTLFRVPAVAVGQVLKSAGTNTLPAWGTLASTDLSNSANIALLNATQVFTGTNTFSNNVTLNGTPSAGTDAVHVNYVTTAIGNAIAGIRKGSVRAATTANGTLASAFQNGSTIDTVTLATGDLILIKNQSAQAENGVYVVQATGAPVRATWMDAAAEIDGVYVAVEDGSQAGTLWITVSEVTTLNTDAIVFTQIQTSGTIDGTGVTDKVAVWQDSNTLTNNTLFHFDNTNSKLYIGHNASSNNGAATRLTVRGTAASTAIAFAVQTGTGTDTFGIQDNGTLIIGASTQMSISNSTISRSGPITIDATGTSSGNVILQSGDDQYNANILTATNAAGGTAVYNIATASVPALTVGGSASATKTSTSVTQTQFEVSGGFTVSGAGTNTFTAARVSPTINQSTHTGIIRGIHIDPTLTALTSAGNWRALEISSASGWGIYQDNSGVDNFINGQVGIGTATLGSNILRVAGSVRFDLGSDATGDTFYRDASGNFVRLAAGTDGHVLTLASGIPSWAAVATSVSIVYVEGSTLTTVDLDANTGVVKDRDGNNVAFTLPTNLDLLQVFRNGMLLNRTGTGTTRDYSLNSGTNEITFAVPLTADETVQFRKPA